MKVGNAYGFANEGTIKVEMDIYGLNTITLDLKTKEGYTIRGEFFNYIELTDETATAPMSTLPEDCQPDLSSVTSARVEYNGNFLGNGLGYWRLLVNNYQAGSDSMTFDFLFPAEDGYYPNGIPAGTYQISRLSKPGFLMAGFINTYLAGVWYTGPYDTDGTYWFMAPCVSGTLTLEREANGDYTLEYDFLDDATTPHRIWGSWSGPATHQDLSADYPF